MFPPPSLEYSLLTKTDQASNIKGPSLARSTQLSKIQAGNVTLQRGCAISHLSIGRYNPVVRLALRIRLSHHETAHHPAPPTMFTRRSLAGRGRGRVIVCDCVETLTLLAHSFVRSGKCGLIQQTTAKAKIQPPAYPTDTYKTHTKKQQHKREKRTKKKKGLNSNNPNKDMCPIAT